MTLDQHVRAFLSERRLTGEEIEAVMKIVKGDAVLGEMPWGDSTSGFSYSVVQDVRERVAAKVITWMNKYRSNHPARALFTGES